MNKANAVPAVQGVRSTTSVKSSKDMPYETSSNLRLQNPATPNLSKVHTHVVERVVKSVAHQVDKPQFERDLRSLVNFGNKKIRRNARAIAANNNALRRYLGRLAKGSSAYEIALLHALVKIRRDDTQLQALGYTDDILLQHIDFRQQQLQAYLNISEIVEKHQGLADLQELTSAYESIILTSTSTLTALSALVRRLGTEDLDQWRHFLTKAVVADLVSQPAGGDKVQLMHILQELKSFRVLGTLKAFLERLQETRVRHVPLKESLQTTLEMTEQPVTTMSMIEKWVQACHTEEQILFFQDYRNLFGNISTDAYKSEEQQRNVKSVLQKKIDHLVYNH